MESYILRFFSYHQPRRIRVIENLLVSRRTVANLFWGQQYGLLNWLGADRQLQRADYDALLRRLVAKKLIVIDDQQQARLTSEGVRFQEEQRDRQYHPHFFTWYWLANTNQLSQRLLLGMQVVSELAYHNSKYAPVTVAYNQLLAVKRWFYQADRRQLVAAVYQDLNQLATGLASADPRLATLLMDSLVGHNLPTWTTDQIAQRLAISLDEMLVLNHDLLLGVAAYCRHVPGPLHDLLAPLLNAGPLSQSAVVTLNLYQRGQTVEEIAARRRLKLSTVREHLLETAILCPGKLDWDRLLPVEKRAILADRYPAKDVTTWQFQNDDSDDEAAFFEYRLFQIRQGEEKK